MFGLSLGKILFTVAVIIGVWVLFRVMGRTNRKSTVEDAARKAVEEALRRQGHAPNPGPQADPVQAKSEDLVRCSGCGSYGVAGSTCGCGKTLKA
ncbi:MAG: hypothetical protein ACPGOY_15975 [Rhodospirillaceae bacterium]